MTRAQHLYGRYKTCVAERGETVRRPRIVVADDNLPFLQNLLSLLGTDFDVVATASDGKSALELIRRYEPDIVVIDLHMPAPDGIEIAKQLAQHPPSPPVVVCSVETDPDIVDAVRQAGALAFVFKSRVETDLVLAVKSALRGKPFASAGPR
jgi:DNA-binding NarL/FixJ family response regulator